jgi:hypothetical protein
MKATAEPTGFPRTTPDSVSVTISLATETAALGADKLEKAAAG